MAITDITVNLKPTSQYTRVIQMFPDWPPGARTANDTALCY